MNQEAIQKRNDFIELQNNIEIALKESSAISIFSEKELDLAGFYIKKYKELDKEIEKTRKSIVAPVNKEVKEINNVFKLLSNKYSDELSRLNGEVNDFLKEKRKKQEEERQKEQKELEDAVINEAEMFDDESVLDNIPQVEIKRESLGDMSNTVTTARIKKWKVIDLEKVPRKYLMLDEKMINKIRKDYDFEDKSPIEGLEFYFEENIRSK
ncbi:MAG: hypothetical protein GY804_09690 [Alphaproteobacteria bacterium]|nr:hypothetical protein [Alphaproteobacteria bacterium]